MEEADSSSVRGRKPYTRARAKLSYSSKARHGEAGFFSSTQRKKQSMRTEVSTNSSSDDPGGIVVIDLISSGDDSSNNSGDNPNNNSNDDFDDHEASSKTILHNFVLVPSLINCSNASISICCRKLLHMTLTGFGLKSTRSRNRLKRRGQVLKPFTAKQLSCKKLQLL
jgi:hypothetical protein